MARLVALVTGASGDIGAAISLRLADAGADVIGSGRNRERLLRIVTGRESRVAMVPADLTNESGVEALRASVLERGRLDILVLCSGIYKRSLEPDTLARQLAANVIGPYSLLQAVRPQLIAAKGLVVFINSTQGLNASPNVGQFAATQHAMHAIADSTRGEINSSGVRVTSIFLGRTATTRQADIFSSEERPYAPERLIQPEDVAEVVASLVTLPHTSEITEIRMRPRLPPLP
jgi:NADP-dependent 3-hydroxy acid dehydrogenase YdfG